MENASNEENSKFRTYRIHPGTGFILGLIAAILLAPGYFANENSNMLRFWNEPTEPSLRLVTAL